MAFEALKADVAGTCKRHGPARWASRRRAQRPAGQPHRLRQNTREKTKYGLVVMDVFTRKAAAEPLQNKNAETVAAPQVRRAGADGGRRELCGTTDLGNEFATLDRELPEAVHRTKRPEDRHTLMLCGLF